MKSTHKLSMVATVGVIAATTLSVNPASAFSITTGGQAKGSPAGIEGLTTTVSNAVVIDFNDAVDSPYSTVSTVSQQGATYLPGNSLVINNGGVLAPTTGAAPYPGLPSGSTENTSAYLSLPTNSDTGLGSNQVTITLPKLSNYFGLHWGSMDDVSAGTPANQIEFFRNGQLLATFTPDDLTALGLDVEAGAGPNNQDRVRSNPYVNFSSDGSDEWFDEVVLTQLGNNPGIAFESDNHAYRPVPEPLTILGSGLALGFGAIFKKQQSRRR
ncbi:MAG: PEP-CTERM sorting domain-containing protein [Coleofasciculus sp. C2-GNP5-27]|uniref:PEP-CTERM sorting domain-containing protein n=1 Tax=Coleofasciculus sp. C1-SOL-03 TaxID=3069522 RepID=UPI0032FAE815